jgi:hypothetical protein
VSLREIGTRLGADHRFVVGGQRRVTAGRDAAKLAASANKVADQVPGAMVESLVLDPADLASVGRLPRTLLASARP